jgi:bacteriorhodopsin
MSDISKRANDALNANPNVFRYPVSSDINLTTHGSDWYWAVTAVMVVSTIGFMGWSFAVPRRARLFHYITAAITLVASIAYFTMASNLGYAAIPVEFVRSNSKVAGFYREIFYVRYIDWFVTTPVSLLRLQCLHMLTTLAASSSGHSFDSWSSMANSRLHHPHGRGHGCYWSRGCARGLFIQVGLLRLRHGCSVLHLLQHSLRWTTS